MLLVVAASACCVGCSDDDDKSAGVTGGGLANSGESGGPTVMLGEERSGDGTYYDATGAGACSFDPSPDALNVAALNAPDWESSAYCGACADVTGPSGQVRVRIVDLCPECASGDLDMSPQAFDQVAERELGRVPIEWQFVACDVSGNVAYRYKDGANPFWTAVQVHNHRLPIRSMEWSKDGSEWEDMERQEYNYFLESDGFGDGPTQVRITAIDGQRLVDELPPVEEYLVVEGSGQFD